MSKPYISDWY